jgi:hypothetical protein
VQVEREFGRMGEWQQGRNGAGAGVRLWHLPRRNCIDPVSQTPHSGQRAGNIWARPICVYAALMKSIDRGFLAAIVLGALAIAATVVGESFKLAWMSDWLSPFLLLLFLITLGSVGGRLQGASAAPKPTSPVRRWLRGAAVVTPIWCFLNIEMVGDASVDMRLFGLSWSMGAYEASRVLAVGGFFLGAIVVGLSARDAHRNRKEVAGV